ncbi:MAG: hypothetical protein P9L99_14905 [Candidatus Lernaella stagnicola]|nr:hypothetical protein [Candidatus Lernaella stagnicola]
MNIPGAAFFARLNNRPFWLLAAFYLLLGIVLAGLPLTNYLGLEFSLVIGIFAGLFGGPFAVSLFHRRYGGDDRVASMTQAAQHGAGTIWLEISLAHFAAMALAFLGLIARGFFVPPCAPFRGAGFFLLMPVISALYAGAWGVAAAGILARPRRAKMLVTLLALGTLVMTGLDFLIKPTVWLYNPFFGYFPGPIYDAAASPEAPLLAYRLANLAEACLIVLIAALFWQRLLPTASRRRPTALHVALIVATAAASLVVHANRFAIGFDMNDDELQSRLGGYLPTEHFDIYYPARQDIEREIMHVAMDHEFRFAQIERELGIDYPHRITSYIYPDEKTKKKWIGAGGTEYADCAKHQMHLNWESFPLRILHHEMIHVMLSEYGVPPLGFSSSIAVTEGVAVAFGGPERWEQDLDRWAAGMKAIGRLPQIERIMGLRFWEESGARAYTAAGSFTRFLTGQENGLQNVLRAYRWGDLEAQFGVPLRELEKQWLDHLAAVEATLTAAEIERARYRFGSKSIFERRCPREVARLLNEADRKQSQRYFHKADLLFRQAAELDRDNPRIWRYRLAPLLRLGKMDEARVLAEQIIAAQGTAAAPATDRKGRIVGSQIVAQDAEMILAGIAWNQDETDAARAIYRRAMDASYRSGRVREAACALYALDHPEVETPLRNYLVDLTGSRTGSWDLLAAALDDTTDPVVIYLLARRALRQEAFAYAAELLDRALDLGLPHDTLVEEAWRGKAFAYFMLGDYDASRAAFSEARVRVLARGDSTTGLDDWLGRTAVWTQLRHTLRGGRR